MPGTSDYSLLLATFCYLFPIFGCFVVSFTIVDMGGRQYQKSIMREARAHPIMSPIIFMHNQFIIELQGHMNSVSQITGFLQP